MRNILITGSSYLLIAMTVFPAFAEITQDQLSNPNPVKTPLPSYPLNSVAFGMVTLWVRVQEDGKVKDVTVLKSIPSLDEPSVRTASLWLFEPARIGSHPVESYAILNFVYGLDRNPTKYKVHGPEETGIWMNNYPIPFQVYPINPLSLSTPPTFTVIASVDHNGKISSIAEVGAPLEQELLDLISKNWIFVARRGDLKTTRRITITFSYVMFPVSDSF